MKRLGIVRWGRSGSKRIDLLAVIQEQARLSETRRELLVQLGLHAIEDVHALSSREEELGGDPLAASERYRYLVDAITRGLGQVIADLAHGTGDAVQVKVTGND